MIVEPEVMRDELLRELARYGELLYSPVGDQVIVQVRQSGLLIELAEFLSSGQFYLITVVGNDERELEDRRFKIYYLFSHPISDLFVLAEYLLEHGAQTYPSLHTQFPAVDCFEREMLDMLGLRPDGPRQDQVTAGSWLHESYPDQLYPLRREQTAAGIRQRVTGHLENGTPAPRPANRNGGAVLPVGPIHAGIIEPGQFLFTIAGEAIEDVGIRLGFTHRGIERIFQSHLHLLDGWWLAEQVSGDSSFAHSLAYCRAAETLTDARVPRAATLLRGIFLELERVHNHVADVAALAQDVSLDRISAELMVVREHLLRLNERSTGHRYLRRVNRPGGVALPLQFDLADVQHTLHGCVDRFLELANALKGRAGFRARTIGVGVLTGEEALALGVTGLSARASGILRDSRWDHPTAVFAKPWLEPGGRAGASAADDRETRAGDVFARFLNRVDEVAAARAIVAELSERWADLRPRNRGRLLDEPQVLPENNYTFAVGYAEGFRGDVVYWLMQGKMRGIYRCKVRDPSMLNWPGLRASVLPRNLAGRRVETMLADFPLVNKSFNLSYSGNDL